MLGGKLSSTLDITYSNEGNESDLSEGSRVSGDICRICHCGREGCNPLLTPCYCSGSLKFVHQTCLQQWLTASETNFCELCKFPFLMHTKAKPLTEWRGLDMSGVERRRLCCTVLFHCAAALCVIWSLCVLIERATEEVKRGLIGWPFWTKLAVVTVGLTGGIIFMYVQCRQYIHLCQRWKARNRIFLIQNVVHDLQSSSVPTALGVLHGDSNVADSAAGTMNSYEYNFCRYDTASLTCQINKENEKCLIDSEKFDQAESISNSYFNNRNFAQCSTHTVPHSMGSIVSLSENRNAFKKSSETELYTHNIYAYPSKSMSETKSRCHNFSVFLDVQSIPDNIASLKNCYRRFEETALNDVKNSNIFNMNLSHSCKKIDMHKKPLMIDIPNFRDESEYFCHGHQKHITKFVFKDLRNKNSNENCHLNPSDIDFNYYSLPVCRKKKSTYSLNVVIENVHRSNLERSRLYFKSLPNLSNSNENLVPIN